MLDPSVLLLICCAFSPSVFASLLVLLPPVRRFARAHWRNLALVALGVAVIASYLSSFLVSLLTIQVDVLLTQAYPIPQRNAAQVELLLRQIVPPPLRQDCYTLQLEVCKSADLILLITSRPFSDPPIPFVDPHLEAMTPQQYHDFQQSHDLSYRQAKLLDYLLLPYLYLLPSLIGSAIMVFILTRDWPKLLARSPAKPIAP